MKLICCGPQPGAVAHAPVEKNASTVFPINLHPPLAGDTQKRFVGSRNQWTTATAARDLLLGLETLLSPGSHVLANFSVTRNRALQEEGLSARLKELNDSVKYYEVTIKSGGATTPGGHVKAAMAAKGINDWSEKSPARTWFGNGMGANATSVDPGSPTGGRGKPVKFFASPLYSPPFTSLRIGVYQAGYPLAIVYPYPVGQ